MRSVENSRSQGSNPQTGDLDLAVVSSEDSGSLGTAPRSEVPSPSITTDEEGNASINEPRRPSNESIGSADERNNSIRSNVDRLTQRMPFVLFGSRDGPQAQGSQRNWWDVTWVDMGKILIIFVVIFLAIRFAIVKLV